ENQNGREMAVGNAWLSLRLSKHDNDADDCRKEDCFMADIPVAKRIKNDEPFYDETDLTDLYWKNVIHSGDDLKRPKNLFTEVPPGKYYLSAEFLYEDGVKTAGKPRTSRVVSNKIAVILKAVAYAEVDGNVLPFRLTSGDFRSSIVSHPFPEV